jgi:hypothetical protein
LVLSFFVLTRTAWVWSGLRAAWLIPAVAASAAILLVILFTRSSRWWRDPFFHLGGLFLLYLGTQWFNAGRTLLYDASAEKWLYSPPPHPGWPSAVTRPEAAEMLAWFFPAWCVALAMRSPWLSRRGGQRLFAALVYSTAALALMGVVQFATQTRNMYWLAPMQDDFFASFGYTNHAAAYFVLVAALGAGLLFREVFRADRPIRRARVIALTASTILCIVGANLSLSRAGVILAGALALFIGIYGMARGRKRLRPVARLHFSVLTAAAVVVLGMAVLCFGDKEIRREFEVRNPARVAWLPGFLRTINLDPGTVRPVLARGAWRLWKDHPWLGVGGWGYRYMLALYVPETDWTRVVERYGAANVHCDPLQFLAEFGALGFGLGMLGAVGVLAAQAVHSSHRQSALFVLGVTGILLVCIFGLFDLPFRCPAILCAWTAILAGLPKVAGIRPLEPGRPKSEEPHL